jgi:hypothetical protein
MRKFFLILCAGIVAGMVITYFVGVKIQKRAIQSDPVRASQSSQLAVLWTSADPDVAHRVCLMYTHAAQKNEWFDPVKLIVWGPSARLLAGDRELQSKVQALIADGVQVQACVVCADSYGVTDPLRALGIEVIPMGEPLTDLLKDGWRILTF